MRMAFTKQATNLRRSVVVPSHQGGVSPYVIFDASNDDKFNRPISKREGITILEKSPTPTLTNFDISKSLHSGILEQLIL
jgi:hypothetical protein